MQLFIFFLVIFESQFLLLRPQYSFVESSLVYRPLETAIYEVMQHQIQEMMHHLSVTIICAVVQNVSSVYFNLCVLLVLAE